VEVNAEDPRAVAEYCRQIESYLCRKNGGHLIRVVGPAFEQVREWARQGVPLKIAFRGIDQYCERQIVRSPRRRPVRIEFCAADILALFDDWRRALGVTAGPAAQPARKASLVSHVERAVSRLIAAGGTGAGGGVSSDAIQIAVADLDRIGRLAKAARGGERDALIQELDVIDRRLLELAVASLDEASSGRLRREAEEELASFGGRLPADVRASALEMAFLRLVRESLKLPRIAFE
jgi:hypothetical protein